MTDLPFRQRLAAILGVTVSLSQRFAQDAAFRELPGTRFLPAGVAK